MKSAKLSLCLGTILILKVTLLLPGCASGPGPAAAPSAIPGGSIAAPAPLVVSIIPSETGVQYGGDINFSAITLNATDHNVTWSISEGSAGGSISSTGAYKAPASGGLFHIVATSVQDPTKSATATVNVTQIAFDPIGSLATERMDHTATMLPSGKVLIAGGGSLSDVYDTWDKISTTTEMFDPSTGVFSTGGKMLQAGHTATLLPNGDVLFAAGATQTSSNTLTSTTAVAELLKSTNGVIGPTGDLLVGRQGHAAALLKDGRVLITGGSGSQGIGLNILTETELYDPATKTFSAGPNMNVPRMDHTATVLPDGTVLIAGGYTRSSISVPDMSDTAEIFDPSTGQFRITGKMKIGRWYHTATLLPNGKVLIAGGVGTAELYDPGTGTFTATGNMAVARIWDTATLLPDGKVLIAGGASNDRSIASTEIFDPATGTFTMGPTMRQGRFRHTATLLENGRVLIIGGGQSLDGVNTKALASAEIY